jgi:hypothetical protein
VQGSGRAAAGALAPSPRPTTNIRDFSLINCWRFLLNQLVLLLNQFVGDFSSISLFFSSINLRPREYRDVRALRRLAGASRGAARFLRAHAGVAWGAIYAPYAPPAWGASGLGGGAICLGSAHLSALHNLLEAKTNPKKDPKPWSLADPRRPGAGRGARRRARRGDRARRRGGYGVRDAACPISTG